MLLLPFRETADGYPMGRSAGRGRGTREDGRRAGTENVLLAVALGAEEGMGAVRFSLGRTTTREELEMVIRLLKEAA